MQREAHKKHNELGRGLYLLNMNSFKFKSKIKRSDANHTHKEYRKMTMQMYQIDTCIKTKNGNSPDLFAYNN